MQIAFVHCQTALFVAIRRTKALFADKTRALVAVNHSYQSRPISGGPIVESRLVSEAVSTVATVHTSITSNPIKHIAPLDAPLCLYSVGDRERLCVETKATVAQRTTATRTNATLSEAKVTVLMQYYALSCHTVAYLTYLSHLAFTVFKVCRSLSK